MNEIEDRPTTRIRHIRLAGLALAVIGAIGAIAPPAARATIQDDSCIYPDVEYPMPCDDDDGD